MTQPASSDVALRWTALILCAAALLVAWPVWPVLVLAAWTAHLLRPLLLRLDKALKGRRGAASLLSLLPFIGLAAPVAVLLTVVVSSALDLVNAVMASSTARGALDAYVQGEGPLAGVQIPQDVAGFTELAQTLGARSVSLVSGIAGAAVKVVVGLFLYFAGAWALLNEGDKAWAWVKRNSPLPLRATEALGAAFQETGRGLLVGVGLTTLTQGVAATIIYLALGVPQATVLGPITGLASMIPFVGTGLVWVPLAIRFAVLGETGRAIILAVLGVVVISSVDNFLRPVYAKLGALKLNIYVLFVALFGGLATFGAWGALMGPLLVRLAMEALALLKPVPDELPADDAATSATAPPAPGASAP